MPVTARTRELEDRLSEAADGYVVEAQGLLRALTRTGWAVLGKRLVARSEGTAWALGDWLVEGARGDRQWTGGKYAHARRITGYSPEHLSNLFRTASAFPRDSRRPRLSFSIHRETLRVPAELRGELLARAEAGGWTCEDLVRHIQTRLLPPARAAAHGRRDAAVSKSRKYYRSPAVRCPQCGHEFPIRGNKVSQQES